MQVGKMSRVFTLLRKKCDKEKEKKRMERILSLYSTTLVCLLREDITKR
jgi:hypothetical protein